MEKELLYKHVLGWFQENMPGASTELNYKNPFQLLVAVILSGQCTDKRVNMVTPRLFRDFPNSKALAAATPEMVHRYIQSITYPLSKAKYLVGTAQLLEEKFKGQIPSSLLELTELPGVGRKTANVIASIVFNKPVMAVDTHVFRVSNRIGLTSNSKTPYETEKELPRFIPKELISSAQHWLILDGRYVCVARKPHCSDCGLQAWCNYYLEMSR